MRSWHLSEDLKDKKDPAIQQSWGGGGWAFPAEGTSGIKAQVWKRLWHTHRIGR